MRLYASILITRRDENDINMSENLKKWKEQLMEKALRKMTPVDEMKKCVDIEMKNNSSL